MKEATQVAAEAAALFRQALGDHLRSVVLYGSVARAEYVRGKSDINLLLLLDDIDTAALMTAAPVAARMSKERLNPVVLEWEDRLRAADVFGIELLDMQDAHQLLHGVDPFEHLEVAPDALRLQAERELRSKLLTFHSALLHGRDDDTVIGQLLVSALPSFVTYLRAVLRLARETVPRAMREVILAGCSRVGAEPDGLLAALDARTRAGPWKLQPDNPIIESYRSACERTARYVDALSGDRTP